MKSTSVRGTPVRSISAGNEGMAAGKPANMSGTVNNQYQGDQSNRVNPRSGTPYTSQNGNSPTAKRLVSSGKLGDVIDTQAGVNLNLPDSNGNGVILDGMNRASDYTPTAASTLDSPVPHGAATFAAGAMRQENIAHLGKGIGVNESQAGDDLNAIGGVMSRGMAGFSKPSGGPESLVEDDVLRNLGAGGAVG